MEVRESRFCEVEKRSSLSVAAGPVLDKMFSELADTRFSILLTDRSSVIIDRRVNTPSVSRALDRVLAAPGFQYLKKPAGPMHSLPPSSCADRSPSPAMSPTWKLFAASVATARPSSPIAHRLEGCSTSQVRSRTLQRARALPASRCSRYRRTPSRRFSDCRETTTHSISIARQSPPSDLALGESLALTSPALSISVRTQTMWH